MLVIPCIPRKFLSCSHYKLAARNCERLILSNALKAQILIPTFFKRPGHTFAILEILFLLKMPRFPWKFVGYSSCSSKVSCSWDTKQVLFVIDIENILVRIRAQISDRLTSPMFRIFFRATRVPSYPESKKFKLVISRSPWQILAQEIQNKFYSSSVLKYIGSRQRYFIYVPYFRFVMRYHCKLLC